MKSIVIQFVMGLAGVCGITGVFIYNAWKGRQCRTKLEEKNVKGIKETANVEMLKNDVFPIPYMRKLKFKESDKILQEDSEISRKMLKDSNEVQDNLEEKSDDLQIEILDLKEESKNLNEKFALIQNELQHVNDKLNSLNEELNNLNNKFSFEDYESVIESSTEYLD